ncbi:CPXCG motif-containing cysteine-rich protein [Vibrio porteresiae]|uniref:CPXCG motif-containing cysteine-rich protein n=1 Tax=Vibrio porteresiae DSM 19223 TaxID=1123496 RepID=A0ABZ0Q7V1_9VIBR|nr:CPXCG motif-containing cysteine-rich protein [Vibrio porteresiae]WPC72523.1 CPXCG motif-containing cysteine-rich protein [Vibrio porteresiae DSM 19223]
MKKMIGRTIECPHCGHHVPVSFDTSLGSEEFYDDCPACCNPIHFNLNVDEQNNDVDIYVDADDEQYF